MMATQTQKQDEATYVPQNAVGEAFKSMALMGGAGLLVSSIQNSLAKRNVGMLGIFWRTGGAITLFAATGFGYEFSRLAAANLRQKNDSYNAAIGGFTAGALIGLRARTFPAVLGLGATLAVVLSALDYTGGGLSGWKHDPNVDEFEVKQALRKNRRRPIEETIQELGEGRGIHGPGYEERRKERIKEVYGIEVKSS